MKYLRTLIPLFIVACVIAPPALVAAMILNGTLKVDWSDFDFDSIIGVVCVVLFFAMIDFP